MSKQKKLLLKFMSGTHDKNIEFTELQQILLVYGFICVRVKGDHFIYTKENIDEIINIQPIDNMAKPYQVKQVRELVHRYKMEA